MSEKKLACREDLHVLLNHLAFQLPGHATYGSLAVWPSSCAMREASETMDCNCAGVIDWRPSQSALLGSGCTSRMSPSAPAAILARDMVGTSSRRPVAWLGSTMIGR